MPPGNPPRSVPRIKLGQGDATEAPLRAPRPDPRAGLSTLNPGMISVIPTRRTPQSRFVLSLLLLLPALPVPLGRAQGGTPRTIVVPPGRGIAVMDSARVARLLPGDSLATPVLTLPEVQVIDSYERSLETAHAGSEGIITRRQMDARPLRRTGEVLEAVPGVLISQHSGEGKANQYYLRGFNLDHGTDLAITLAGVPVNMPTHAHGQGYSDLNFTIPELINGIDYRKGTYFADEGDFSAAGAVHVNYVNRLERPIVAISGGTQGYGRSLLAASPRIGRDGALLAALDLFHNDGPWVHPDDYRKFNGVLRYSEGTAAQGFSVTVMGYDGRWNSTDQIPVRAVRTGLIDRFGALDPTDGGRSHRYSLSGEYRNVDAHSITRSSAYLIDYKMNLWSNFEYFLSDTTNGDQFEQADDRLVLGARVSKLRYGRLLGRPTQHLLGFHARHDNIHGVGLYHTVARRRLSTTRQDDVQQTSVSPFYENETRWSPRFRSQVGLRVDQFWFNVDANIKENSGAESAHRFSPKLGLVFGPFGGTEYFANLGYGFHSNDARGTTIHVDPATGDPAPRVTPLVEARGAELGFASAVTPRLRLNGSLWGLSLASELLFVGDAGTTEASRPSRRLGGELAANWRLHEHIVVDGSFAWSTARFTDADPVGDHIPGAVEGVAGIGVALVNDQGWFGEARLRYFGPRALIEDNSARSQTSTLINLQAGYHFGPRLGITAGLFNLLDSKSSDIDYYYASRLPGEPADGVEDIHTHPNESRSVRLALTSSLTK